MFLMSIIVLMTSLSLSSGGYKKTFDVETNTNVEKYEYLKSETNSSKSLLIKNSSILSVQCINDPESSFLMPRLNLSNLNQNLTLEISNCLSLDVVEWPTEGFSTMARGVFTQIASLKLVGRGSLSLHKPLFDKFMKLESLSIRYPDDEVMNSGRWRELFNFKVIKRIIYVLFSFNKMIKISSDSFEYLRSLKVIDLSHNELRYLKPYVENVFHGRALSYKCELPPDKIMIFFFFQRDFC